MRQLVRAGTFYGVFKHVYDGGPHYRNETPPEWVKDKKIRRSHRRRLLMRDRAYYSKYWPDLKPSDRVIMPDGKKKYCL